MTQCLVYPQYTVSSSYALNHCKCEKCFRYKQEKQKLYYQNNKIKIKRLVKRWKKENPEKSLSYQRNCAYKKKYNIDSEFYKKMKAKQNHRCLICGEYHPDDNDYSLHVDHCHETGKIRGLLCAKCNQGIGCLKHSEVVLKNAIKYLKKGSK